MVEERKEMWFYPSRKMIQAKVMDEVCKAACKGKPIINHPCLEKCTTRAPPPELLTGLHKSHHHKSTTFLIVTVTLLAASFLLMCAYALYSKLYRTTRITRNDIINNNNNAQVEPIAIEEEDDDDDEERHGRGAVEHHVWYIRTVGLEQSVISSITSLRYKRGEGLVDGTDCSVCLCEFQEDESLRLLPKCSHAFHVACIDTWLRSHTNCPMCRAPVLVTTAVVTASPAVAEVSDEEIPASNNGGDTERDVEGCETVPTVGEIGNVEPSRRSVSLGCLDVKELDVVTKLRNANNSVVEKKKLERLKSGGSRNGQSGGGSSSSSSSSSMKRSHSCNGKFVMCRSIRVADSILPLRNS